MGEGVETFNRHGAAVSSLHSSLAAVMAFAQQLAAPPVFELQPCPPQKSHDAEQHLKKRSGYERLSKQRVAR